jgi:hypothetical protein
MKLFNDTIRVIVILASIWIQLGPFIGLFFIFVVTMPFVKAVHSYL